MGWIKDVVLRRSSIILAVSTDDEAGGFASVQNGALEHLYVSPHLQGHGLGTLLLTAAKDESPRGLACMCSSEIYPRGISMTDADLDWLIFATVRQMKKGSLTLSMTG